MGAKCRAIYKSANVHFTGMPGCTVTKLKHRFYTPPLVTTGIADAEQPACTSYAPEYQH